MTERESDLEGGGNYDDDIDCERISFAARKLLMDIQYEDELDEEVIKVFWRMRRHIPLEDGLWRSPALQVRVCEEPHNYFTKQRLQEYSYLAHRIMLVEGTG